MRLNGKTQKPDDLEALVDGCDLLIIPTTPDILSIDATLETVDLLNSLKCDRYRILLTIIPPSRKTGEQAREALADLPLFKRKGNLWTWVDSPVTRADLIGTKANPTRGPGKERKEISGTLKQHRSSFMHHQPLKEGAANFQALPPASTQVLGAFVPRQILLTFWNPFFCQR